MKYYFYTMMVFIVVFGAVELFAPEIKKDNSKVVTCKVDLPEEYKLITKDTPIQGYMRGDTLVIEFKHDYSNGNTNTNLNSRGNR